MDRRYPENQSGWPEPDPRAMLELMKQNNIQIKPIPN